jgi:hypothetical protein
MLFANEAAPERRREVELCFWHHVVDDFEHRRPLARPGDATLAGKHRDGGQIARRLGDGKKVHAVGKNADLHALPERAVGGPRDVHLVRGDAL